MKNLIVSVAALLMTGVTPVLAHETGNDPRAEKVFATQFSGAENVKWFDLEDGFQRVLFTLNGIAVEAFYDQDAELVGTTRHLFFNQLPLLVMQSVNNKFTGAVIIEVKEINNSNGTQYRIVLEQKDKKYQLRLNSLGDVIEKEKVKK